MKSATKLPSDDRALAALMVLALAVILSAAFSGCTTVTPRQVESPGASFDGGDRNSGFIGWTNVDHMTCGIITQHALDRYNGLIAVYGSRFIPPLNKSEGTCSTCASNLILIQPEALSKFATMNRWHKVDAVKP